MSIDNFIPVVWSARILENLHKVQVFGGLCDRNYEGDIVDVGSSVKINAIGPVTVRDYVRNADLTAPDQLTDASTIMVIDQAKYFHVAIDDVDRRQAKPGALEGAMSEAAYSLSDNQDQYIAGKYADAASANLIGSQASPKTDLATAGKAYEYLVDLSVKLDNNNVPQMGRWVVLPPWYYGWLQKDARFVGYGTPEQLAALRGGLIGFAAGLQIFKSNNVTLSANVSRVMAGFQGAITLASQIAKIEAYRQPARFGDAIKGLMVYGAKTTRPNALAVLYAQVA